MSNDISFESDNNFKYKSRVIFGQAEVPKMVRFLIGKGIVKNEKQAQGILLTTTILFLLTSIYIFTVFVFDIQLFNKKPTITPEQIQQNRERMENLRNRQKSVNTTNTQ